MLIVQCDLNNSCTLVIRQNTSLLKVGVAPVHRTFKMKSWLWLQRNNIDLERLCTILKELYHLNTRVLGGFIVIQHNFTLVQLMVNAVKY